MTETAHSVYDTVVDQYGRPIAAALVTVRDEDGALVDLAEGNPLITDATGNWSAFMMPGTYTLVISKGDDSITRTLTVCQNVERTPFITEIESIEILEIIGDPISVAETIELVTIGDFITIEAV